ncbi:hypothetical protein [Streptomyces sp. NPDC094149]
MAKAGPMLWSSRRRKRMKAAESLRVMSSTMTCPRKISAALH